MKEKLAKSWLQPVLVVLLIVAAFAIGSMWTELKGLKKNQGTAQPQAQAPQAPAEPTEVTPEIWQEITSNPVAVKGTEAAKVTLVEFTDYQCPFCKRYVDDTLAQIEKDYVATGKVKYMIRDLALSFHPNAQKAAEAARCAGAQGQYWAMHDLLFKNQDAWVAVTNPLSLFSGYAANSGLNAANFTSCLNNNAQKAAVESDIALAGKAGLGGTPSFVINGKILVGAQPYAQFKAVIDAALQ